MKVFQVTFGFETGIDTITLERVRADVEQALKKSLLAGDAVPASISVVPSQGNGVKYPDAAYAARETETAIREEWCVCGHPKDLHGAPGGWREGGCLQCVCKKYRAAAVRA